MDIIVSTRLVPVRPLGFSHEIGSVEQTWSGVHPGGAEPLSRVSSPSDGAGGGNSVHGIAHDNSSEHDLSAASDDGPESDDAHETTSLRKRRRVSRADTTISSSSSSGNSRVTVNEDTRYIQDFDVVLGNTHTPTFGTKIYRQIRQLYAKTFVSDGELNHIKDELHHQLQDSMTLPRTPLFWYDAKNLDKVVPDSERRLLKRGKTGAYAIATDEAIRGDIKSAPKKSRTRAKNLFHLTGLFDDVCKEARKICSEWAGQSATKNLCVQGFYRDLDRMRAWRRSYEDDKAVAEQQGNLFEIRMHYFHVVQLESSFVGLINELGNAMVERYRQSLDDGFIPVKSEQRSDSDDNAEILVRAMNCLRYENVSSGGLDRETLIALAGVTGIKLRNVRLSEKKKQDIVARALSWLSECDADALFKDENVSLLLRQLASGTSYSYDSAQLVADTNVEDKTETYYDEFITARSARDTGRSSNTSNALEDDSRRIGSPRLEISRNESQGDTMEPNFLAEIMLHDSEDILSTLDWLDDELPLSKMFAADKRGSAGRAMHQDQLTDPLNYLQSPKKDFRIFSVTTGTSAARTAARLDRGASSPVSEFKDENDEVPYVSETPSDWWKSLTASSVHESAASSFRSLSRGLSDVSGVANKTLVASGNLRDATDFAFTGQILSTMMAAVQASFAGPSIKARSSHAAEPVTRSHFHESGHTHVTSTRSMRGLTLRLCQTFYSKTIRRVWGMPRPEVLGKED